MQYNILGPTAYDDLVAQIIAAAEGELSSVTLLGDGEATIGIGYTFSRNNNTALWQAAGIVLTASELAQLQAIDAAPTAAQRLNLAAAFTRTITHPEATRLLAQTIPAYLVHANALGMPLSSERAAFVSLTYNRKPDGLEKRMPGFFQAIRAGDRAEAWFQLRYMSWGSFAPDEPGLRARRLVESNVFGLYDTAAVTDAEAQNVLAMFNRHRSTILNLESLWGENPDGTDGAQNLVDGVNNDTRWGTLNAVTLVEALTPARDQFITWLNNSGRLTDHSSLTGSNWNPVQIYFSSGKPMLDASAETITSFQNSLIVGEVDKRSVQVGGAGNDWLVGGTLADVLQGGTGNDVLFGGAGTDTYIWNLGDGNDEIRDSDRSGNIVISGTTLPFGGPFYDNGSGAWESANHGFRISHGATWRMTILQSGEFLDLGTTFVSGDFGLKLESQISGSAISILGDNAPTIDSDNNYVFDSRQNVVPNGPSPGANDNLHGSTGRDIIKGFGGNDAIDGGDGDDDLFGGIGNDIISGGKGSDSIFGEAGSDLLLGSNTARGITPSSANSPPFTPGPSYGVISLGWNWALTWANAEHTLFNAQNIPGTNLTSDATGNYVDGGADDDFVFSGHGNDIALGGAGNDYVFGQGGSDVVYGGADNDILRGDGLRTVWYVDYTPYELDGNDVVYGEGGNDTLLGQGGDDVLFGDNADGSGTGEDEIWGDGTSWDDTPLAYLGSDYIDAGGGDDVVHGGGRGDIIFGRGGHDVLYGDGGGATGASEGDDSIFGGDEKDEIYGDGGNDYLVGGTGADTLTGGEGDDTYFFTLADAIHVGADHDTINESAHHVQNDRIVLGDGFTNTSTKLYAAASGPGVFLVQGAVPSGIPAVNTAVIAITNAFYGGIKEIVFESTGVTWTWRQAVNSITGPQRLASAGDDSEIYGAGVADELLVAGNNVDVFGGWGNDKFVGDSGTTTYHFDSGDGLDTINDQSAASGFSDPQGSNTLALGDGIAPRDVRLTYDGRSAKLNFAMNPSDGIVLGTFDRSAVVTGARTIDHIQFSDGTNLTWDQFARSAKISVSANLSSLDVLGTDLDDEITTSNLGGTIYSGAGSDTIHFGRASGNDVIENDASSGIDQVRFDDDVTASAVQTFRNGNDLIARISDTGNRLVIRDFFSNSTVSSLVFSDSTTWTAANVSQTPLLNSPTSGDDFLLGSTSSETISGGAGNDLLFGGAGGDILNGDDGDDHIRGEDGNDVIVGGAGIDVLDGGLGNDSLTPGAGGAAVVNGQNVTLGGTVYGGAGDDTLYIQGGEGASTAWIDVEGSNSINFGSAIDKSVVRIARSAEGGVSIYYNAAERVDMSLDSFYALASLKFNDGSVVSGLAIGDLFDISTGSVGDSSVRVNVDVNDIVLERRGDNLLLEYSGDFKDWVDSSSLDARGLLYSFVDGSDVGVTADSVLVVHNWYEAAQSASLSTVVGDTLATPILGTPGDDTGVSALNGTYANDSISGLAGNDYLYGLGGNDVLIGGQGSDYLRGSFGSDTYFFDIGDGADTIEIQDAASDDVDVIEFGAGISPTSITFSIINTNSLRISYPGGGTIDINQFFDPANDEKRIKQITFVDSPQTVITAAQIDTQLMVPTQSDDYLRGTNGSDTILGLAGNDSLFGMAGDDAVDGGAGNDLIDGGAGADTLNGGDGNDEIHGGGGNDSLFGGVGDDQLDGGDGNDTLDGGLGVDTYDGGLGNDTYLIARPTGAPGVREVNAVNPNTPGEVDTIVFGAQIAPSDVRVTYGGQIHLIVSDVGDPTGVSLEVLVAPTDAFSGTHEIRFADQPGVVWTDADLRAMSLVGGTTDDTIFGFDSADTLRGNGGNDVLFGGLGNDDLRGGAGRDALNGEIGNDVYRFGRGDLIDEIDDADGSNRIVLDAGILPSQVTLYRTSSIGAFAVDPTGDDLVISIDNGQDQLRVANFFDPARTGALSQLEFANGTIWNNATIISNAVNQSGTYNEQIGTSANETFSVDNWGDFVLGMGGVDTVNSSVSFSLGSDLENLTLTGSLDTNATGNSGNNVLTGNAGANIFDGRGGFDTMIGGAGDDTYYVDGTGTFDPSNDTVTELVGGGYDTIIARSRDATLDDNVEQMIADSWSSIFGSGVELLAGNALNNVIDGRLRSVTSGNWSVTIDGGAGADIMIGSADGMSNRYVVDNTGDVVREVRETPGLDAGIDTVESSISYTLGDRIEVLEMTSSTATTGTGNAFSNRLDGSTGTGAQTLIGLGGDDTYVLGSGDVAVEAANAGKDTVILTSSVGYAGGSVSLSSFANVENLAVADSFGVATLNGDAGANVLSGNASANILVGGLGDDTLTGNGGTDVFGGFGIGTGNDVILVGSSAASDARTVEFSAAENINISQLQFSRSGNDLGVQTAPGNSISVQSFMTGAQPLNFKFSLYTAGLRYDYTAAQVAAVLNGTNGGPAVSTPIPDSPQAILGQAFSYQIAANSFTDIESQSALVYSATLANGSALPNWLSFDAGTRTFSGTPSGSVGPLTVRVRATDAGAAQAFDDFIIDVSPGPIIGTSGNDNLVGSISNDVMQGLAGNDILDGGLGADQMYGGTGDDTYFVDNPGDVTNESPNEGIDLVKSSVSFTLSTNVENLILTGTGNIDGTGSGADNIITGNSGSNTLLGGAGNDTLDPGTAGTDSLQGQTGDDTYVVTRASGVALVEAPGEGTDTVQSSLTFTLATNFENLTLTGTNAINGTGNSAANVIVGNTASNTLTGNNGDDTLDGGGGQDTLIGGGGNDSYIVDSTDDVVTEGSNAGTDTIFSNVTLSSLALNVENVTLTGAANIGAVGSSGNNTLTGNSGDNSLDGGSGTDTMIGGLGNDTYFINVTADIVQEAANEGVDTVMANVTNYTLANFVENLTLQNSIAQGNGNSLDNVITGNTAINTLNGNDGNDTLYGLGGADVMNGGNGNDILDGGAGSDNMTGGAGDDTYFVDATGDAITEAAGGGTDTIQTTVSLTTWAANVENMTLLTGSVNTPTGTNASGLNNVIIGNSAANSIEGGAGDDTLTGAGGSDVLKGGLGADIYRYSFGDGADTIDNVAGDSLIDRLQFTNMTSSQASFAHVGSNLVITLQGGGSITVSNWYAASANRIDFLNFTNGEFTANQVDSAAGGSGTLSGFAPPAAFSVPVSGAGALRDFSRTGALQNGPTEEIALGRSLAVPKSVDDPVVSSKHSGGTPHIHWEPIKDFLTHGSASLGDSLAVVGPISAESGLEEANSASATLLGVNRLIDAMAVFGPERNVIQGAGSEMAMVDPLEQLAARHSLASGRALDFQHSALD